MRLIPPNREPKELKPRTAIAAVIAGACFLILVGRLYDLQIVRGDEFSTRSRDNYVKVLPEPAPRGLILDHRGRVIADNRPSFDVYLTAAFCKHPKEDLGRLATLLNLTNDEIASVRKIMRLPRKREERYHPYLVRLDITRDQLDVLESESTQLECVDVIPSAHRQYNYGSELAHVVGYLSQVSEKELAASQGKYRQGDFVGRRGIERALENELRGVDGKRRVAVDALGRELDSDLADQLIPADQRLAPAVPGHNVVLSIDLGLQHIADEALRERAIAGAVVAVDVHTGFILAMASEPSFDPNEMTGRITRHELQALVDDPLEPLFQRAIQQRYHPGSTFKVVTALAGLQGGYITPQSATTCNGGYTLGSRRWRCWSARGHGSGVNLRRGLKDSCDTYFYWLADKMGLDPIAEMGLKLGFGRTTGIEISPESPGLMPTEAYHQRVDHAYTKGFALNAAIGQGAVNVTPLQMAMAYATIANGGTLYRPHLVRRIEDWQGHVLKEVQPEVVREVGVKPGYIRAVMDGLIAVVNEPGGTAYSKRLADIEVAGKTGTAQNVVIGKVREKLKNMAWATRDHAWFAAVAPADDPEIAVAVINEHAGHGGTASAPVAMAVIQAYFDLKKLESNDKQILNQQQIETLKPSPRYAVEEWASRHPKEQTSAVDVTPQTGMPNDAPAASDVVADPSLLAADKSAPPSHAPPSPSRPERPVPRDLPLH